ncbi:MAG: 4Fe-4S dicluster domain-containing protein [Myxococcaceae bacterium]|nr:4Fe-4S dicluster domain-containing protein [Myxococcaceae bacterium]
MAADRPISYQPTDGLSYDPAEAKYWEPEALKKELERAFELCHGCRMCFKYCDSFPTLFSLIDDAAHGGDVTKLTAGETRQVMDHCFQCKLCEVQCPYTPRDKHEYQLDFPKLVHRYQAQRQREEGTSLRDQVLGDPDGTAAFARLSFGIANVANRVSAHRFVMEKVLGIHRDKLLPDFAGQTFESWAVKEGKVKPPGAEVALFQTCYVQNNEPEIGKDTVEVLEKSQVKVACVEGLVCCGMPAWEHGDLEGLQKAARRNLDLLVPHVKAGAKVLAINPTCSMMLRREYPELVAPEDRERAKLVAEQVMDTGEYLWSIRQEPRFNQDFQSTPGEKVAYHAPCHLRAQGKGFKGRDVLRRIPGVEPATTLECCGHDGTYAMKVETFEASKRVGQKSFESLKSAEAEVWVTECPLAAKQFEQHAGKKALHPMTVLARAYRKDGFPTPVAPKKKDGES